MTKFAWCAGLFDGEGSIDIQHSATRSYFRVQVGQSDRRVLNQFQGTVRAGKVRGPYGPYSSQRKPYFLFTALGEKAYAVLEQIGPWLSEVKREAALKAMGKLK